jgi:integrase
MEKQRSGNHKARRRSAGLTKRGNIWWIDKRIKGLDKPLRESTGTSDLDEAERYLAKRISDIRNATIYGMRPARTFQEAAVKYLEENTHKRSLHVDAENLTTVMPFIRDLPLQRVHDGSLRPFVNQQLGKGLSQGTINRRLAIVRRILNLAARSWRDEHGLTWLETAPLITLPSYEPRQSYVLSWEEQNALFQQLPNYLRLACLFDVNCGAREQEVCQLKWEWEIPFEGRSLFILPRRLTKNKQDRILVPNDAAQTVLKEVRNQHREYVFSYKGKHLRNLRTMAWRKAWRESRLPLDKMIRQGVHNLRHTYATRLRAAGVSHEDRRDLLGHSHGSMTTHYSQAEIYNLIAASNKACVEMVKPLLTLAKVRNAHFSNSHNSPTVDNIVDLAAERKLRR